MNYNDLPIKRGDKLKLTVTMDVSAPQAYALMEMFKCWNFYSKAGCSRDVSFFVDGDGDFHPDCQIKTEPALPELPKEQAKLALVGTDEYDYDPISLSLYPNE